MRLQEALVFALNATFRLFHKITYVIFTLSDLAALNQ